MSVSNAARTPAPERPGEWSRHAACTDDPDLFFSTFTQLAKKICTACRVANDCHEWIMDVERGQSVHLRFGVIAGLTPHERAVHDPAAPNPTRPPTEPKPKAPAAKKKRRRKLPPPACPSTRAYKHHVRQGEPIDDACRAVYNEERRADRIARQNAKVRALWARGLSDTEIARMAGVGKIVVQRTRDRLGLLPHDTTARAAR
ncbi:WhiB family transcriptional regulator [Streptomyces scopuliridis]|uniref:WhiB family transcriptional regulator n=1 Tax=Streptomyces scopuliridis TaxID=452529 RepID=UPI00343824A4